VARAQGGRPAAILYPFGHPTPVCGAVGGRWLVPVLNAVLHFFKLHLFKVLKVGTTKFSQLVSSTHMNECSHVNNHIVFYYHVNEDTNF
jgi:hypothetical protein